MVRTWLRVAALAGVAAVVIGCGDGARPTAPSPAPPLSVAPPPPPANVTPFPPLSGAATAYRFSEPLEDGGVIRVRAFTERSSFVLYESGGCYLQYDDPPWRLRGRYEREQEQIRFYFSESSAGVDATGIVRGDFLEVRYSLIMQHSDFENAVYRHVE